MKFLSIFSGLLLLGACGEPSPELQKTDTAKETLTTAQRARVAAMADTHHGTIHFKDSFNALDPQVKRSAVARASGFDPADDYWGLPRTPGYEEVDAYCSGCHSLSIVMQQRVTKERWDSLIKWMIDKQGMPPLPEGDDELVKTYLSRHFSDISE